MTRRRSIQTNLLGRVATVTKIGAVEPGDVGLPERQGEIVAVYYDSAGDVRVTILYDDGSADTMYLENVGATWKITGHAPATGDERVADALEQLSELDDIASAIEKVAHEVERIANQLGVGAIAVVDGR